MAAIENNRDFTLSRKSATQQFAAKDKIMKS